MRCRYYENQFPEPEEVVIVNVTQIGEMGAYVTLLEYDDIEGMILLSELSRRRIRSINKLVRVNRTEIVKVIRVDKEKGVYAFFFSVSATGPLFAQLMRILLPLLRDIILLEFVIFCQYYSQQQVTLICPSVKSTPKTLSSARSDITRYFDTFIFCDVASCL